MNCHGKKTAIETLNRVHDDNKYIHMYICMDTTLLSKQFELFMDKNTRQNNSGILFVYLTLLF